MDEEKQEVTKHAPLNEREKPEVTAFKEEISKADGTLLALHKTTIDGRRLYIAARHVRNPWEYYEVDITPAEYDIERRLKEGFDKKANPDFYGWEEDRQREGKPNNTGVMLVDMYVELEGKITPIGHMDWWLREDYANGGGNMHQATISQGDYEQAASNKWHKNDFTAFKVDYDQHYQGLGSLMVATSAVVLPAIGIKKFFTGGLLEPAIRTYQRFGISEEDFPPSIRGNVYARNLPIERLAQHPQVNKTISEFVS